MVLRLSIFWTRTVKRNIGEFSCVFLGRVWSERSVEILVSSVHIVGEPRGSVSEVNREVVLVGVH